VAEQVDQLYRIVRETLEGRASEVLLGRMRERLEEAEGSPESLLEACTRLEKMANLFLGADEARALQDRFGEWRSRST
jgi:hypothetical protein